MPSLKPGKLVIPVIAWTGFIFLAVKSLATKLSDPDLWWHLASGRAMFENRTFLRTDIFSHTLYGAEWINFEWFSQSIVYLVYRFFGIDGLFFTKLLLSLLILLCLILLLRKSGTRGASLWIMSYLGFWLLRPRLNERIELVTFLFFSIYLWVLLEARHNSFIKSFVGLSLMGLIMAMWCNMHGGFIFGLALIVLFNAGARWSGESQAYKNFLDRLFVVALAAMLINPYGPRLVSIHLEHLFHLGQGLQLIQEWQAPSIREAPLFWCLFLTTGCFLVYAFLTNNREAKFWTPLVLVFLVWGSFSHRNIVLASIVALVFVSGKQGRLASLSFPKETAAWVFCGILLFLPKQIWSRPWPGARSQSYKLPVALSRFIESNKITGRMYNSYEWGGYLEWSLGPKEKIFMDGRYIFQDLLIEHSHLDRVTYLKPQAASWDKFLGRYGVDYAVVNYGTYVIPAANSGFQTELSPTFFMFPSDQWALVAWDDTGGIFLKRTPYFEKIIKENEYKFLSPFEIPRFRYLLSKNINYQAGLMKELAQHESKWGYTVMGGEIKKLAASQHVE